MYVHVARLLAPGRPRAKSSKKPSEEIYSISPEGAMRTNGPSCSDNELKIKFDPTPMGARTHGPNGNIKVTDVLVAGELGQIGPRPLVPAFSSKLEEVLVRELEGV